MVEYPLSSLDSYGFGFEGVYTISGGLIKYDESR